MKNFTTAALDSKHKAWVIHIAAFSKAGADEMHLCRRVWIGYVKWDKALIKVAGQYIDFADIFLSKWSTKLPERTAIHDHVIE